MMLPETHTISIAEDFSKIKSSLKAKAGQATGERNLPGKGVLRIEEPIPHIDPLEWLARQNDNMRVYWSERDNDFEMAGAGSVYVVPGDTSASYQEVFARMKSVLRSGDDDLRFYGGFRFDKNRGSDPIWKDFGSSLFFIPQLEIVREHGNTKLILNIRFDQISLSGPLIEEAIHGIEHEPNYGSGKDGSVTSRSDIPSKTDWVQNIEKARVKFRKSELQKIVLARRSMFDFSYTIDAVQLMARMKTLSANAFQFCFQPAEETAFIGASPELLYRRGGNQIFSEAIAGTRPRGLDEATDERLANELLDSPKDIQEHAAVCQWIEDALVRLCDSYETDEGVDVLKSNRVQHLYKSYRGELKENDDAGIISALHPTPAVAGTPQEMSLQEIRKFEAFDRGWYAGPVGWVGSDSAEFAVGIRSGLIHQNRVYLFSGAGILPDSDAEKEWQELEHKISHYLNLFQST